MNRNEFLERIKTETFDVCIIGGGATGAGCALDAQSRGLKTILIEKEDFGAATSSKSTKLIHGGVRYLEQAIKNLSWGQFKMVRKALNERKTLLKIAPHITRTLQLITPCTTWLQGFYYFIGLKLYDWISGGTNIGNSRLLKRSEALKHIPTLKKEHLHSAVLYFDGQMDDQRFNLALIQTAVSKGALCINHCVAKVFIRDNDDNLAGLKVTDQLSGTAYVVNAKTFVNATGAFADGVRKMANENLISRIRVSKGVHILLPGQMMPSFSALLIPKTKDGRLVFAIPYQQHLLVGTTDDETQLTEKEFGPNADEIKYLLDYVNEYLNVKASPNDVLAGFGGLRPLITAAGSTKDLVRDHEVETDDASGLISILGGKWTTYRLMAKDTIDTVEKALSKKTICTTENIILAGSETSDLTNTIALLRKSSWDEEIINHLISKYGDRSASLTEILKDHPEWKERLLPNMPYTLAELYYVMQHEMACTVKDVLSRRWGIQLSNWQQTIELIPVVGKIMTTHLNWNEVQQQLYIDDYKKEVETIMKSIDPEV